MADVIVDPKNENVTELTQQGIKAYILKDYNASITALCRVIELLVAKHDEKHDSLGQVYLYYGKSLLELSREEGEALGDAVVPKELKDSEEDDDDDQAEESDTQNGQDETKQDSADGASKDEKVEDTVKTNTNNGSSEENIATAGSSNVDGVGCSSTSNGNTKNTETTSEEPTDLQLAWEVLEIAKLIFEQRGDKGKRELAETHIILGEISLEDDNVENAIEDIKKGLSMQKEIYDPNSRVTAETLYKLGLAYSLNNQIDNAVESFKASTEILSNRLTKLKENSESNKEEIKDIEELIPEINEKIADFENAKEEVVKKLSSVSVAEPDKITTTKFEGSSSGSNQVTDISHLVKRKRKLDEIAEECEENAAKKAATPTE